MYNNIGKRIKTFATIFSWVSLIACVVVGLVVLGMAENASRGTEWIYLCIGCILILSGFFVSWFSNLFTYAFGELVDKVCDIEKNTRSLASSSCNHPKTPEEKNAEIEKLYAEGLIDEEEYQQIISKNN